jgi:hypothetical protein
MSVAFWSVSVTSKKEESVQPPEGYVLNVTNIALESGSSGVLRVKTVSIEGDDIDAVVAAVTKNSPHCTLGLVFGYDVPFNFKVVGDGVVHVSGYYQPAPEDGEGDENDFDEEDDEEDDSDSDGEESNAKVAAVPTSKPVKQEAVKDNKKAAPVKKEESSEEEDSDEDVSDDNEVDAAFIKVY